MARDIDDLLDVPPDERAALLDAQTDEYAADRSWVEGWKTDGPPAGAVPHEVVAWVQARPEAVQTLIRQFPPSCLVRATRTVRCPRPGTVGIVRTYTESGLLGVIQHPRDTLVHHCEPGWLEVAGYHGGLTRAWVETVIGLDY